MQLYHLVSTACEEEGIYTNIVKTSKDILIIKNQMKKEFISNFNEFFSFDICKLNKMITCNSRITKDIGESTILFEYGDNFEKCEEIDCEGIVDVCNVECKNDKIIFTMEDCNGRERKYLYSIHKIEVDDLSLDIDFEMN